MFDIILRLDFMNDTYCIFVGESRETSEVAGIFGSVEHTNKYPSLLISREMWDSYGKPTVLSISGSLVN